MEDSDSVAVARVKAGDGDAYRVLVDRHSRSVFRLAYRMTGNESDSEDVVHALPSPTPGPDRLLFSDRVRQTVAGTLSELSQQERTAFVLRHFEGQSIEEISTALGLSGNAAKHSIFRAVQKLRRALEPMVNTAS